MRLGGGEKVHAMPFCEHCGVEGSGDFCASCGQVRSVAARPAAHAVAVPVASQTHGVPALVSFFIPGVGQLIKGHVGKGIATWFVMGTFTLLSLVFPLLFLSLPVAWLWNVYDAYKSNNPSISGKD